MARSFVKRRPMRRTQAARLSCLLLAAWLARSPAAAQSGRDAEIDPFLSRIPPVVGEFEACLDADPPQGLILVRDIRQIVLSRLFWRMRERGDPMDVIDDRLGVLARQIEQMRHVAARHLQEISADRRKLDAHCEHSAILVRDLLEALR